MGCGSSKVDDLPLVTLCRERRDHIKAASDHRYALAAAHISYFQSLRDVGEALHRFSEEEVVVLAAEPSVPGSPVLTLPSDEGKLRRRAKTEVGKKSPSSPDSISHSYLHFHSPEEEGLEDSHLHLSSITGSDSEQGSDSGHIHIDDSLKGEEYYPYPNSNPNYYPNSNPNYYPNSNHYPPPTPSYDNSGYWGSSMPPEVTSTSYMYYAKKGETPMQSMVYEEPGNGRYSVNGGYGYSNYSQYNDGNGGGNGFFGFSMPMASPQQSERRGLPDSPQAPPSPPKVSTWDFLNFFETYDNGIYEHNNLGVRYGYASNMSSPDSNEVREREGIPDLEDETDLEALRVKARKKVNGFQDDEKRNVNSGEGTSKSAHKQQHSSEGSSKQVKFQRTESPDSHESEIKSSSGTFDTVDTSMTKSPVEGSSTSRKKGVSFELDEGTNVEVESSKRSSLPTLTIHRTRDLQEVVNEIRDDFETASSYGLEVAVLLEVGDLPYQPKTAALKVIFSRILHLIAPFILSSHPPPLVPSVRLSPRSKKMAKEYGDSGKDSKLKPLKLSLTLEKLYAWEKKLYKEVKDEERLRVLYEKTRNRLKYLDEHGAESSKIEAAEASVRKLLTKINVCLKAVDTIASRIHKLRDEELLPQVTDLIYGLIRMWKSMLKCHQKQFQAIMESKMRKLRENGQFRRDTGLKAIFELKVELLKWCSSFHKWVHTQKSYVESLHEWISRCILEEQEETDDGVAPFSPGRIGAPPIFVICNDWFQAMERISQTRVEKAISNFAATLHVISERQDEEQRRRVKTEYLSKDFEKRLRQLRAERGKLKQETDASSDRSVISRVPSGSGISPLDDLKVDLDSMRHKLAEESARHNDAIKLVNDVASNSLQVGLTPILEALGSFTSEALKAHEQVRLPNL